MACARVATSTRRRRQNRAVPGIEYRSSTAKHHLPSGLGVGAKKNAFQLFPVSVTVRRAAWQCARSAPPRARCCAAGPPPGGAPEPDVGALMLVVRSPPRGGTCGRMAGPGPKLQAEPHSPPPPPPEPLRLRPPVAADASGVPVSPLAAQKRRLPAHTWPMMVASRTRSSFCLPPRAPLLRLRNRFFATRQATCRGVVPECGPVPGGLERGSKGGTWGPGGKRGAGVAFIDRGAASTTASATRVRRERDGRPLRCVGGGGVG